MKNKILIIITSAIVIIAIAIIALVPKKEQTSSTKTEQTSSAKTEQTVSKKANEIEATFNENGDIEIKTEDIQSENATIIDFEIDGIKMGLLAIKDKENNIDVAFNTCQVCNGSPKAYFVQKNSKLVCQNCGNTFSMSTIGASANGCNPMTISDENITKTDTGILISKQYLQSNETLFKNWKK